MGGGDCSVNVSHHLTAVEGREWKIVNRERKKLWFWGVLTLLVLVSFADLYITDLSKNPTNLGMAWIGVRVVLFAGFYIMWLVQLQCETLRIAKAWKRLGRGKIDDGTLQLVSQWIDHNLGNAESFPYDAEERIQCLAFAQSKLEEAVQETIRVSGLYAQTEQALEKFRLTRIEKCLAVQIADPSKEMKKFRETRDEFFRERDRLQKMRDDHCLWKDGTYRRYHALWDFFKGMEVLGYPRKNMLPVGFKGPEEFHLSVAGVQATMHVPGTTDGI